MTTQCIPTDTAKHMAQSCLADIIELVATLTAAQDDDDSCATDEAQQAILEDALEVSVSAPGWHSPGYGCSVVPTHYRILLCFGGPRARWGGWCAVQVTGELGAAMEPSDSKETWTWIIQATIANIEYQNWFTPWTRLPLGDDAQAAVLQYAQQFYFG
jgi:hypothetical protein